MELVKILMARHNISLSQVKQHNAFSGKNCPSNLSSGAKGINWNDFLSMVKNNTPSNPTTPESKPVAPSKPVLNQLTTDGYWGSTTKKALQAYFGTTVDGVISGQPNNTSVRNITSAKVGTAGSLLIKAMQRHYGTTVDGKISNPSQLIRAIQKAFGTVVDGHVSKPSLLVNIKSNCLS